MAERSDGSIEQVEIKFGTIVELKAAIDKNERDVLRLAAGGDEEGSAAALSLGVVYKTRMLEIAMAVISESFEGDLTDKQTAEILSRLTLVKSGDYKGTKGTTAFLLNLNGVSDNLQAVLLEGLDEAKNIIVDADVNKVKVYLAIHNIALQRSLGVLLASEEKIASNPFTKTTLNVKPHLTVPSPGNIAPDINEVEAGVRERVGVSSARVIRTGRPGPIEQHPSTLIGMRVVPALELGDDSADSQRADSQAPTLNAPLPAPGEEESMSRKPTWPPPVESIGPAAPPHLEFSPPEAVEVELPAPPTLGSGKLHTLELVLDGPDSVPDSSSDEAKAVSFSQIPVVAPAGMAERPFNPALLEDAVHPLDRGDFLTPLPISRTVTPSKK